MKKFIHDMMLPPDKQVYIEDDSGNVIQYGYAEFIIDEPTYIGLPKDMTKRVWVEGGLSYISDGTSQYGDSLHVETYTQKVIEYTTAYEARKGGPLPSLYVIIDIDKQFIKNDNTDVITVTAKITATNEYAATPLDITKQWPIYLRHTRLDEFTDDWDVLLADFVNGEATITYKYDLGIERMGSWVLDPNTFDSYTYDETEYQFVPVPYINGIAYTEKPMLTFYVYRI